MESLFMILLLLSMIAFILGLINPKWIGLKTRKKSMLVTLVVTVVFLFAIVLVAPEADESAADNKDKQEQAGKLAKADEEKAKKDSAEEKKADKEEDKKEAPEKEAEIDDQATWDDVKTMDKIVGKSDKDYSDLTISKPSKVRNDKTGNWRKSTITENVDIEEYILSYSDLHMNEDEVHFIINFNYNTTTWISEMNSLLYVEIREYVEKEEHDAETLGNGMTLKSYVIYPDGDIEELEY